MLGIPPLSPIDGNPSIYHIIYNMCVIYINTVWLFHIAMENGPFVVDLPIKNCDFQ